MTAAPKSLMTVDEFLAWAEVQPGRYELYNGVVYAISTKNGHLLARIPVGGGPHGVCFYPLPGRYSLGHTDNMR